MLQIYKLILKTTLRLVYNKQNGPKRQN